MSSETESKAVDIKAHWNEQAKQYQKDPKATFNDVFLMEKEIKTIQRYLKDNLRVLDAGCGNGYTSFAIIKDRFIDLTGLDFSEEMISAACAELEIKRHALKGEVQFVVHDITEPVNGLGFFDIILCKRVLINLVSWERQKRALDNFCSLLSENGLLLLSEACSESLENLNRLRRRYGLEPLGNPWYNRYVSSGELEEYIQNKFSIVKVERFSSTYYFGSRILQPFILKLLGSGKAPKHTSRINRLFSHLPTIGDVGTQKMWVLQKRLK